jgi:hypothetical protein
MIGGMKWNGENILELEPQNFVKFSITLLYLLHLFLPMFLTLTLQALPNRILDFTHSIEFLRPMQYLGSGYFNKTNKSP